VHFVCRVKLQDNDNQWQEIIAITDAGLVLKAGGFYV